jgi:hypothetical protein
MKRASIKRLVGMGLLGSALGAGCNEAPVRPAVPAPVRVTTTTYSPPPARAGYQPTAPTPAAIAQAAPQTQWAANPALVPVKAEAPAPEPAVEVAKPQTAPPEKPLPLEQSGSTATAEPAPAIHTNGEKATTATGFGHAEDYSWLSGQLQYSHFNKAWRLRYASVDEADLHGGSVTLSEDLHMAGLKDGQYVRLEGRLVNPDAKGSAPMFQVNSIQVIDK